MIKVHVFILSIWLLLGGAHSYIEKRVLGGKDAPEGFAPYQVSLRAGYVEGVKKKHFCGGSILNKNWILSAAHCTSGLSPSIVTAFVGTNKLSTGGDSYNIDSIINHEKFSTATLKNDISVLKITGTFAFGDKVKAIALPTDDIGVGEKCTLTGWGDVDNQDTVPDQLQTIQLTTISVEKCNKGLVGAGTYLPIEKTQVCTFTKAREGICGGDSGGPLVKDGKQVGVVSWGAPCAVGVPDVFTRVFSYNTWITEKTKL